MKILKSIPWLTILLFVGLVILTSSCANTCSQMDYYTNSMREPTTYGFFGGLLHGIFMPFGFVGSLISPCLEMYASNHVKGWYDFGYLCGVIFSIGGGIRLSMVAKKEFYGC